MNRLIKILLSWLALFALASGSMTLTGCSKEEDQNLDLVKYDIRLDVDEEAIEDAELKTLANKINGNQLVSHKLVSKKFQEFHSIETDSTEVSAFISEISAGLKSNDFFERKSIYEARIEGKAETAMLYNRRASSVSHIITENRMQCYSGTSLSMMVSREVEEGVFYEDNNYVAIFQAGHVLPGKMIKIQGQWALIGVESTSTGDATHFIGMASELEYGKVRVVDASYFVLIEMYKAFLQSPTSTADTALEKTAAKYGINLQNYGVQSARGKGFGKLQPANTNKCNNNSGPVVLNDEVNNYAEEPINKSPFGFGCSTVTDDEDKVRQEFTGIGSNVSEVSYVTQQQIQAMKAGERFKPTKKSGGKYDGRVLEKTDEKDGGLGPFIYAEDHGVKKDDFLSSNRMDYLYMSE